jgi:opacity protein-like surface antigen
LAYAKGGLGWSRINYSDSDATVPYSIKASATNWGWTVGAGLEYALTSNWSTFIEYNHADYGSKNVTLTDAAKQNSWYYKFSNRIDTVMVGVNYRFGK